MCFASAGAWRVLAAYGSHSARRCVWSARTTRRCRNRSRRPSGRFKPQRPTPVYLVYLQRSLTASTACAVSAAPRGRVYVPVDPPAPIVETRVVAPGPGYVWVPGYHAWDGRAYIWRPGRWDRWPRPNARWVPAHWVHERRNGWYLIEGHWR